MSKICEVCNKRPATTVGQIPDIINYKESYRRLCRSCHTAAYEKNDLSDIVEGWNG